MKVANKVEENVLQNGINYTGDKGPAFGVRHVQVIIMAFGMAIAFVTNTLLTIALVAMRAPSSPNKDIPTYNWKNRNTIISAILWSGLAFNLLSGYLAKLYGPKWFVVGGSFINSVAFMLIPTAAKYFDSTGVIVCRVLQGIAMAFVVPLNTSVMGRWVPPAERSRLGFIGAGLITILLTISSVATGYISGSSLGWPWIFYLFGGIALAWTLVYTIVGAQGPDTYKLISRAERKYLMDTIYDSHEDAKTPLLKMATSLPFWAIVIGYTGLTFLMTIVSSEMSNYLESVLGYDIKSNGVLSAIPTLTGAVAGVVWSILSDAIPARGILTLLNSRRLFQLAGISGLCSSLLAITFIPAKHGAWAVVLLCVANVFLIAATVGGTMPNVLDVSPKYAGIIMGVATSLAQSISILAPLTVQWICTDESDASQWRTVFLIASGIALSSAIFFVIFATDQRQEWDAETDEQAMREKYKRKGSVMSLSIPVTQ